MRCGSTSTTGAAHAAESRGDDQPSRQRAAEMAAGERRERLVGALYDSLAADVDPAARGHLAVHRQAAVLELAEIVPRRPGRDEHGVDDEDARRAGVRRKNTYRLARLDEQRLVVLERRQRPDDRVERRPAARGLARSAIDDQIVGALGHVGI